MGNKTSYTSERLKELWKDPEHRKKIREGKQRAWARLNDTERQTRLAAMHDAIHGKPRSEQHSKNLGESVKGAWANGYHFEPRRCRGCGGEFVPKSGKHRFCEPECQRRSRIATKHGLLYWDLVAILDAQGGVCALCESEGGGWTTSGGLVVDHDHKTGAVRGFLCATCNTAIGKFGESAERLRRAAAYVEGSLF